MAVKVRVEMGHRHDPGEYECVGCDSVDQENLEQVALKARKFLTVLMLSHTAIPIHVAGEVLELRDALQKVGLASDTP